MNIGNIIALTLMGAFLLFGGIGGCMWGYPHYNVYSQRLAGEAEFARAEQQRQVIVRQAQAQRDAASMHAEAEVARARGVAEANQIIGDSLRNNEAYLRYLWISNLGDNSRDRIIVYVPTEANLPLLETQRLAPERRP